MRAVALGAASLGTAVLLAAGFAFRGEILERWYLQRLRSDDSAVVQSAVSRLGEIGSIRALPAIWELFRKERAGNPDQLALGFALRAIVLRHGSSAVPSLVEALGDPDPAIRGLAADLAGDLGIKALAAVPALAVLIAAGDPPAFVAESAIWRIGPDAVPRLQPLLGGADEPSRFGAARALSRIDPGSTAAIAIPDLMERLRDESVRVRRAARHAMANIGAEAVPHAVQALLSDPDPEIRWQAAHVLVLIGPAARAAIPALERALADENGSVRLYGKWAILRILGPAAAPAPGS